MQLLVMSLAAEEVSDQKQAPDLRWYLMALVPAYVVGEEHAPGFCSGL